MSEDSSNDPNSKSGTPDKSPLGKKKESWLVRLEKGLHEFYVTPYRRSFARAQRDEDDLFMLLVFAETLGVPNPAAFYTMEMLPLIYDRFHEWHIRMGMERSPLDHISCC